MRSLPVLHISLFLFLAVLLAWVRVEHEQMKQTVPTHYVWSGEVSPVIEKIVAGSIPGFIADFRILDIFSIYYDAKVSGKDEEMRYIEPYLKRAQYLDPKFFDVYRLASSILVYDAHMPREGVDLLQKGIVQRPDAWEFPFYAGFIAHDQLNDDKLAFELMAQVATRENTPLLVINLASRFLASSSSLEDAILFLKSLLQLVPEENRDGIRLRIKQLEEGTVPGYPQSN